MSSYPSSASASASASSASTCGPCVRASDNVAWNCPARMADGRLFTDYRPRCDANLQFQAPMSGSHEYRQFLINNGANIIDANRAAASSVAACGPCVSPLMRGTMMPEADRFVCDKLSCARVAVPDGRGGAGLGTGRDYGMTPAARAQEEGFVAALTQQQDRMGAAGAGNCCGCTSASQGDFGAAFPGAAAVAPGPARWAMPGGGTALSGGDAASAAGCPL